MASIKVVAETTYGPTSLGKLKLSARFPAGSIKFGPATAPTVDPQTTNESCLARVSSVDKSTAANLA